MSRLALRYRLALVYMLLVWAAMTVLDFRIMDSVRRLSRENLHATTANRARLAARLLSEQFAHGQPPDDYHALAEETSRIVGGGIDLLDGSRRLVASGGFHGGSSGAWERHKQTECAKLCHDEQRDLGLVHETAVVNARNSVIHYVRLTVSAFPVAEAVSKVRRIGLLTMLLTMAVAGWLSFRIAASMTAPLHDMETMARRVAEGDLAARIDIRGGGELAALAASLNQMAQRLENSVARLNAAARKTFAADIGHHLRTPVTALRATCDALLAGGLQDPGVADEFLNSMARQTERLSSLLDDLLTLARASGAAEPAQRRQVDLSRLARDVIGELAPVAATRGVRLLDRAVPDMFVHANPQQLALAIANLVDNATRHSPDGEAVEVHVHHSSEGGGVEVRVSDHGPGVAEDLAKRVFEPFVTTAPPNGSAGSGLGLTLVKEIVEAHGGEVGFENCPGGGANFYFRLPAPTAKG